MSDRLPVVFFGHGSPTNAMEDNRATRGWQEIAASVGPIKQILCISAHWYGQGTGVTAMESPRTIHDFGRSLPAPLFDFQYPAPGSPQLATRVQELCKPIDVVGDQAWGLDHGTWSVFWHAWPNADVPVVQLKLDATQPDEWHIEMGRRLRPLRDEGVLIVGSGNIVHNLSVM
ncbi:MAG: 4,5-DOPA dioxygenase extradiol, partial [Gammaproteobacteria bacterium]